MLYDESGWDNDNVANDTAPQSSSKLNSAAVDTDTANDDGTVEEVALDDMMQYHSVKQVATILRSSRMVSTIRMLTEFSEAAPKNAIPKDDPEHAFLCDCSSMALQLEVEKSKVNKFIRDHYSVRFPELVLFLQDGLTYAKVTGILRNAVGGDLSHTVDELDDLLPSHVTMVILAAASTTMGRSLTEKELAAVLEAVKEMESLETAKQVLLEYIQQRMPLVSPNLCALLGSGIVSQMFALTSSITAIASMDPAELISLGSKRHVDGGIKIKTTGFLVNSDLVASHPPQLRPKALRLVANAAVTLARLDDNRRASDNSMGLRFRDDVKYKMIQWTEPLVVRGAAHNTYERHSRKRARPDTKREQR